MEVYWCAVETNSIGLLLLSFVAIEGGEGVGKRGCCFDSMLRKTHLGFFYM
jgi:hypothetical protein